ncbi:hypothetical protein FQR65_LT01126 [Abscondita terminalis]|nr:hypothetical protein FQR65_LT01126 [Abscondita terminalis]
MKAVLVLLPLLGFALAFPVNPNGKDAVLRNFNFNDGLGEAFGCDEQGSLKNTGSEDDITEVRGQFSYLDDYGREVVITFEC